MPEINNDDRKFIVDDYESVIIPALVVTKYDEQGSILDALYSFLVDSTYKEVRGNANEHEIDRNKMLRDIIKTISNNLHVDLNPIFYLAVGITDFPITDEELSKVMHRERDTGSGSQIHKTVQYYARLMKRERELQRVPNIG